MTGLVGLLGWVRSMSRTGLIMWLTMIGLGPMGELDWAGHVADQDWASRTRLGQMGE
jgi:hypothetical protein